MKSLPLFVSVIVPLPALIVLLPVTASAPVWPIAPLLLVAARLPVTVPLPRFSAPVLVAVSAPVASVPRVSAFASVICVVPPARFTAPVKSLPMFASVRTPPPLLKFAAPAAADCTMVVPAACVMPTACTPSVPVPTLTLPRISPLVSRIDTLFAPLLPRLTAPVKSLPLFVSVIVPLPALIVLLPVTASAPVWPIAPLLLVAARLPVTVPLPRFSAPVLVAVSAPVASVPRVSAFASVICVVPPARFTAPVKSLPMFASVRTPPPLLKFAAPAAADCTMVVPAACVMPTACTPSVPVPTLTLPRISPLVSRIDTLFAPLLLRPTAPVKSLLLFDSVIALAPAARLLVPVTLRAPV